MKDASFYGLVRHGTPPVGSCSYCGGMKKACYKRLVGRQLVYYIMPCHGCSMKHFKEHPNYSGMLEVADTWVDLPAEDQLARERQRVAEAEARALQAARAHAVLIAERDRMRTQLVDTPIDPVIDQEEE